MAKSFWPMHFRLISKLYFGPNLWRISLEGPPKNISQAQSSRAVLHLAGSLSARHSKVSTIFAAIQTCIYMRSSIGEWTPVESKLKSI